MKLDELRKKSSSNTPLEGPSAAPGVPSFPPVEPTATEGPSNGEEVWGQHTSLTPSGIEIYYQAGKKRLYRVRNMPVGDAAFSVSGEAHGVWLDVPSVSEILDNLNKPGLPWWGMKVGVEGIMTLFAKIRTGEVSEDEFLRFMSEADVDAAVALLTQHKITVNHVRDKAGDRGTAVHDALEIWAKDGIMPNPDVFDPAERGYVEGLKQFIIDSGVTPLVWEVMVASVKYRYAGRFDLGGEIPDGAQVVTKSYPKRKSVVSALEGGNWMLDLKTSKGVYESHHLQLGGYNLAVEECYNSFYPQTGVIHVFDDGRYELVKGKATSEDWLTVRALYDTMKALK